MAEEAQRGLDWRREHGRGGTEVGIARARDIANKTNLSLDTVKRMNSFFARHEGNREAEGWRPGEEGYPSNGRIAWALWGGDPARGWVRDILRREESEAMTTHVPADYWMIDLDRANRLISSMEMSLTISGSGDRPLFYKKNSDAIVYVHGFLSRYNGPFGLLGHSNYESIERAFEEATADESIDRIVLDVDSPGGEIRGLAYCAKAIRQSPKPCVARVAGLCCSAALYLSLAADEIEAESTAEIGSIGTICMSSRPRSKELDERDPYPYVEFVSAVSPLKTAGVDNPAAAAIRQQLADDYGEEFVAWVAERRGVDRDYVLENFGRGGTLSAARALSVGLIDKIASPSESLPILAEEVSEPAKDQEMEDMQEMVEKLQARIAELEAALQAEREKNAEKEEAEGGEMAPEAVAMAEENRQLRDRVAALEASAARAARDSVIESAMMAGKLTPAERATAEQVFAKGGKALFDAVYGSRAANSAVPQLKGHGGSVEAKSLDEQRNDAILAKMAADKIPYHEAALALSATHPLFVRKVQ